MYQSQQTPSPVQSSKDKRSNRRRVSCGFHHKRHQACPENCEGRISHPPDSHPPVQDRFTVGCNECKAFYISNNSNISKNINMNNSNNNLNTQPIIINTDNQPNKKFKLNNLISSPLPGPTSLMDSPPDSPMSTPTRSLSPMSSNAIVPTLGSSSNNSPLPSSFNSISSSPVSGISSPLVVSSEDMETNNSSPLPSVTSLSGILNKSPSIAYTGKRKYQNSSSSSSPIPSPTTIDFSTSPSSTTPIIDHHQQQNQQISNINNSLKSKIQNQIQNTNNSTITPSCESLLFLLEHEVEKEIYTQKEVELRERKLVQQEEQLKVERTQQILDYQKQQQLMEIQRLLKLQEDLEMWDQKLQTYQQDLSKKQFDLQKNNIKNPTENNINSNSNNSNNNNNNNNNNNSSSFKSLYSSTPSISIMNSNLKYKVPDTNLSSKPNFYNYLNNLVQEN
ncbi:prespore-specific protein [Tieghemostelium lacteum]|uniref:Prespore-specific protein n=1 Tax=Tieghemostelium lacteum TaxID=361077 RepID=A0A152A0H1_TIELA|nr:prespore-specific protein [Tieghemostelium lacteum]|eukprot:KYQ99725.1 prespore-specific protein [Tieghemostelium lacteum]